MIKNKDRREIRMRQPKVGVVGVTCEYESGGHRAEELIQGVKNVLTKKV